MPGALRARAPGFDPDQRVALHAGPRATGSRSAGRFRYIGINLPTLDPERYQKLHGTRDLARVLANIDAMRAARSRGGDRDRRARGTRTRRTGATSRRSGARFEPRGWEVKPFRIRSRPASGTFVPEPPPKKKLRGCELMGSRPFEHLHVTATAKAVLCCQDYYEKLIVGDLKTQTVAEVLGGDTMARLRRWTYGVEEAPADFLCRRCEFALGE